MRIAIAYNEPLPSRYDTVGERVAVASVIDSVKAVKEVLISEGHDVTLIGLQPPLPEAISVLKNIDADLIFNLFEGFEGRSETEWLMARALSNLGIPITGASPATLSLCLNKAETKAVLMSHGIPTAPYKVMDSLHVNMDSLGFPVIVKPLKEDASHGISSKSVVDNLNDLKEQVAFIEKTYGSPVLVETFLDGEEFNASVLAGESPTVLPPSQIVFSDKMAGPKILTYSAKWSQEDPSYQDSTPVCPAPVPETRLRQIKSLAVSTYQAVGAPPYARVDMRSDREGNLYVLEVNANPDLSPESGMALQASAAGMSYGELIKKIMDIAIKESSAPRLTLRPMQHSDVDRLVILTDSTGFFYKDEVTVAREVLTECAAKGESSGYYVYVADSGKGLLGFVCFGPTPMTRGTWDIYWIAIDPDHQREGIGSKLLRLAEDEIASKGGRLVLVETSSRELYQPTRRFYTSQGYVQLALIPDFYDVGDGKVIYGKLLTSRGDITMKS